MELLNRERHNRKKMLESERHKYTTVQLRLTNLITQMNSLEKQESKTGQDEERLSVLRASVVGLKEELKNINQGIRRIEGRM